MTRDWLYTFYHLSMNTHEILEGLRNRNKAVLSKIYLECFPPLLKHIKRNHGTTADAEDVFQDCLVVIYRRLAKQNLHIQKSFQGFFLGIGKYIWHQRRSQQIKQDKLVLPPIDNSLSIQADIEQHERYLLLKDKFQMLSKNCKLILQLFFEQYPMDDIAHILGYKSSGYVKKRKCICQKKLIEAIKRDPRFRELERG